MVHKLAGGMCGCGDKFLLGNTATLPGRVGLGVWGYCESDRALGVRLVCADYHPRGKLFILTYALLVLKTFEIGS